MRAQNVGCKAPWRLAGGAMLAISLLAAAPGHAHPAGSSSINRYLHFEHVGGGRFRVAYLLDFAEAPAYAEIDALDADHDGAVTPDEQRRYLDARLPPIIASWVVEVNGDRATPAIVASHLETLPGQGGLETLRIDCELAVQGRAPPAGEDTRLHVRDDTFADHPGWRDITASEGPAADDTQAATGSVDPADGGAGRRAPRVSDATFVLQLRTPGPRVERPARTGLALVAAALAVGAGLVVTWIARLLRSLSRLRRS